jgi:hypothetical protein
VEVAAVSIAPRPGVEQEGAGVGLGLFLKTEPDGVEQVAATPMGERPPVRALEQILEGGDRSVVQVRTPDPDRLEG